MNGLEETPESEPTGYPYTNGPKVRRTVKFDGKTFSYILNGGNKDAELLGQLEKRYGLRIVKSEVVEKRASLKVEKI